MIGPYSIFLSLNCFGFTFSLVTPVQADDLGCAEVIVGEVHRTVDDSQTPAHGSPVSLGEAPLLFEDRENAPVRLNSCLMQLVTSKESAPVPTSGDLAPHRTVDDSQIPADGPPVSLEEALSLFGDKVQSLLSTENAPVPTSSDLAPDRQSLSLKDIAVTYVAGRPDFIPAIEQYIMKVVPKGRISRPHGQTPYNFISALYESVDKFPDVKWHYICDDDNFVNLSRLVEFAGSFDSAENHFAGAHHGVLGRKCYNSTWITKHGAAMVGCEGPGWVCGGPGVLVSRPLALAMRLQECKGSYGNEQIGDVYLALCAMDAWTSGYHVHHSDSFVMNSGSNLQTGAIALHHITPDTFAALGKRQVASMGLSGSALVMRAEP